MGNLLLVTSGFSLLKLDLKVLLIVSKHVLWPKVTPKSLGWIMVILFSSGEDGFYTFIYCHGGSSKVTSLSTRCYKCILQWRFARRNLYGM